MGSFQGASFALSTTLQSFSVDGGQGCHGYLFCRAGDTDQVLLGESQITESGLGP